MTDYGVQSIGFVRKPLDIILAEIEAALMTEFGPGVVQTPQSPLGQINGIFAEAVAKEWENAEDIYQSYDPDQAEGVRLDTLASLRLMSRTGEDTDETFRQAITNQGQARIDLQDISRAVAQIDGVTYSHVWVNDTDAIDANGMPGGSICLAVTGGDDSEIAQAIRRYIVPGVTVFGTTSIESVIEGYCRTFRILRPIDVPIELILKVRAFKDAMGCPPPSASAIKATILSSLFLLNGDDVSFYRVRSIVESAFSNVEVISIEGRRDGIPQGENTAVDIAFIERASIASEDLTIVVT